MKIALLIAPKDFKDESLSQAKLLLEKSGAQTILTSYTNNECIGYHGAIYKIDLHAQKINPEKFDALILIDGEGVDSYKLYDLKQLLELVKGFATYGKIVGSMGNAAKIISRANIIADKKISAPDDEETQRLIRIYRGISSEDELTFDGNLLTMRSSDNVGEFITTLLEKMGVN